MSIFDAIAKTFRRTNTSIEALEKLEGEALAAVESARQKRAELEAKRVESVLGGEEKRTAFRAALRQCDDDIEDAGAALEAVRQKIVEARIDTEQKRKREVYESAAQLQKAAADAMKSEYEGAINVLRRLQAQVQEADEAVKIANENLPAGAERLLPEAEMLCRDIMGNPREVLRSEDVQLWCGENGQPIEDQQGVRKTSADNGVIYAASAFGNRAVQVHLRRFAKMTVKPWQPATFGPRIGEMVLPPLRPESLPPVAPLIELEAVVEDQPAAAE